MRYVAAVQSEQQCGLICNCSMVEVIAEELHRVTIVSLQHS